MNNVLKALEYMAERGGKWESIVYPEGRILVLQSGLDPDKRNCGTEMFVTAVEISDFAAEYKQLKASHQAYQEVRKETVK